MFSRCECFPILGLALATFVLAGSIVGVCDGAEMEHAASTLQRCTSAVVADNESYGDRHQPGTTESPSFTWGWPIRRTCLSRCMPA